MENSAGFINSMPFLAAMAFGYDLINDDYKVIRVVQFYRNFDEIRAFEVKVYSLSTHSWTRVEEEWPKESHPYSSSASLNGAFHWLVTLSGLPITSSALLAFDLATKKFREYTILVQLDEDSVVGFVVLRGCICICTNVYVTLKDVWVIKEYGLDNTWTRLYTIMLDAVSWPLEYCKPLVCSKDGNKVLMEQYDECLFCYDIEERRSMRVLLLRMSDSFATTICVGSLVLLKVISCKILTDLSTIFCLIISLA
jgi:F-box interacting protein